MDERVVWFGPDRALLGIVSRPEHPRPATPTVILLNAGLLHRVGPNRMNVELARRLGAAGFAALRFDTSGVGDSELIGGGTLDIERSRQDVVAAMDAMGSLYGAEEFVLLGLCTGAFNAFRAALVDPRVAGCILLDGYSYPTLRSKFHHYRRQILRSEKWASWLQRRFRWGELPESVSDDLIVFENEVVPKDRFGRELATLLDRDTGLLLVYTGLGPLAFNYARQMHDAFPELDLDGKATVRYYPNADHTFRLPGNREQLFADIEAWLIGRFAAGQPGALAKEGA